MPQFRTYRNDAEFAANAANYNKATKKLEDKVVPFTSREEAKTIAKEKIGIADTTLVFGAMQIKGNDLFAPITYCTDLSVSQGGEPGFTTVAYSKDHKYAACIDIKN